MSHITSISLDPESARLAQRMKREGKNFSKFVRECLFLYYRDSPENEHVGNQESWPGCEPFCLPTRQHFCRVCWPTGTPDQSSLKAARQHISQLRLLARDGPSAEGFNHERLIPELAEHMAPGKWMVQEGPAVLKWLKAQAEKENRFIMPLADLDLEGNAKPTKTEKPKKGLIRRLLSEMGR
jgi:hypothetical protein